MTVRRLKTYTAESGHVYEYYFVGKRAALADDPFAPAAEYIFDVVVGTPKFAISVFLSASVLHSWQTERGRDLTDPEQYAAAKMALFRAFDNAEDLTPARRRVVLGAEEFHEILLQLGVD